MKKTITLIMLLILTGCQYIPSSLWQSKSTMQLPEVRVGTQGVELFLAKGSPPAEVFESSKFTMLITLSNLGASDVEQGVYSISYEPQYVYLPAQKQNGLFNVRGKSEFNPGGLEKQLSFTFNTLPLGPQIEGYTTTLAFNACYPYKTTAPINVCIDTDLTGKKPGKVCTIGTQSLPKGQGGPVAVTYVEQRMLPHDIPTKVIPEFIFTINNKGGGEVVSEQSYREACSGRPLGEGGWNVITVSAALSEMPMTCTPQTVKIKKEGETKVVCRLESGIETALGTYTSPLAVELNYGYIKSIATQVRIVKSM